MLAGTKMILDFMTLIVQALEKRNATSRGKGLCMGSPFLSPFSSSLLNLQFLLVIVVFFRAFGLARNFWGDDIGGCICAFPDAQIACCAIWESNAEK
jgi:hypothetical protein